MAMRREVCRNIPECCAGDDAFIAIAAKQKGVVKYSEEATCYNLLPANLIDYINQRRRWLYAHFQTKKLTGEYPSVLDTLIFSKPLLVFEVLRDEIVENRRSTGYLITAIVVESLIYVLSVLDHILHRPYHVWPVIQSTKHHSTTGDHDDG
jgi:cellulose synthase/poly-beta-1,6-N-acetylglucosamine synthase-like glycosyltransferase